MLDSDGPLRPGPEAKIMANTRKYERYAKKIKIFEGLSGDEVAEIVRHGDKIYFRAGETIFHKGQLGSNIFVVLRGTVDIENDGYIIAKCREGDAFGEMSVLNHRPHCASAAAATDVKLFTIDENQIDKLLTKHAASRFLLNIIHVLSAHLEKANALISQQSRAGHGSLAAAGESGGVSS